MENKNEKVWEQKRVCAWCQTTMTEGFEPATHGICPVCFSRELTDLMYRKEIKGLFRVSQAVPG